jgi:hypothetical protein
MDAPNALTAAAPQQSLMARWPELVRSTCESDADYAKRVQEEKEDGHGEFAVPVPDVDVPVSDDAKPEAEPEPEPKPSPTPCLKPCLKPQQSLASLLTRFSLPSQLLPPQKRRAGIAMATALGVLVLGVVFVAARKSRVK